MIIARPIIRNSFGSLGEPTATDEDILDWTVHIALGNMGVTLSETDVNYLSSEEWAYLFTFWVPSILPQLNAEYGTATVITRVMVDQKLAELNCVESATTPTATNDEVLGWIVILGLMLADKQYPVTEKKYLTVEEFTDIYNNIKDSLLPQYNNTYGTDLIIDESIIEAALNKINYYIVEPPTDSDVLGWAIALGLKTIGKPAAPTTTTYLTSAERFFLAILVADGILPKLNKDYGTSAVAEPQLISAYLASIKYEISADIIISDHVSFIVESAKRFIEVYRYVFHEYPPYNSVVEYVGTVVPSVIPSFIPDDIKKSASALVAIAAEMGDYNDWIYALNHKLVVLEPAPPPPPDDELLTNEQVFILAVDYALENQNLSLKPTKTIYVQTDHWNVITNDCINIVRYEYNDRYGTNLVVTDAMVDAELKYRGYIEDTTPVPPKSATDMQILIWAVDAGLEKIGKQFEVTYNTYLTSAEWKIVSSVAIAAVPDLNTKYKGSLVITQAMIDEELGARNYYACDPGYYFDTTIRKCVKDIAEPLPEGQPKSNKKILMILLFAGAFFLAVFPVASRKIQEGGQ